MKTRWLVLSLALVAVAAVAAVVFSSQPGETSHGVSRGIILWVLDGLHLEISEENMGLINYFLRRGAHLTIYFCMGLGLALAFQWQKKVAPWISAMALGVVFAASDELAPVLHGKPHGQSWGCAVGFRWPCGGVRSSLVPAALLGKTPYVAVMDVLLSM